MPLWNDSIRQLLYPLGYLASILFSLRFTYQWYKSEKAQKSLVDDTFWQISIIGNLLMATHYLIQVNFSLCLVQLLNGLCAKRNLSILEKKTSWSIKQRLKSITLVSLFCTLLFLLQSWLFIGEIDWVRSPYSPHPAQTLSLFWHLLGALGACTFSMRFWLQWWQAENQAKAELKIWFWVLSLLGAFILTIYSLKLHDPVTFFASALPSIGYIRNLVLVKRQLKEKNR
jgi:lipid-A-disaccharide synthase